MTKPKVIREQLSRYLSSIIWVQEWGIQDPLKPSPSINNKTYPPNIATEIPIEQLQILKRDALSTPYQPNKLVCLAKFPFRISYVFRRDSFQNFRSIPIGQLENLLFKASQLIILYANSIDEDIIDIDVPQQQNPFIVRPADDIASDKSNAYAWVVTAKIDIDVKFLSSPDEFSNIDYSDIQPSVFGHPDDLPLYDVDFNPFELKELRIDVNRSELPSVTPLDDSTYKLDEQLILKKENN